MDTEPPLRASLHIFSLSLKQHSLILGASSVILKGVEHLQLLLTTIGITYIQDFQKIKCLKVDTQI